MESLITLQQYSFTCPPSFAQKAALLALDYDTTPLIEEYRKRRDLIYEGLSEKYEVVKPQGAFFIFPKAPNGKGERLVERAIAEGLFMVPGKVFSQRSTHFRICFAAPSEKLERAIEILKRLV